MTIRVAIVDDDALIRDSLKMILEMDKELEVVGTCSNGDEAFKLCQREGIDVVLMDIRMPVCDGILGTKKIRTAFPQTQVLILTTFPDDEYVFQALKNGAHGYMLKNTPSDKIREQIKLIHGGTMLIHSEIASKLTDMLNKEQERTKDLAEFGLTDRETEIVKLISDGLSNKEIAEKIFLGESTVKNQVSLILDKLNLRDRTQIAVFYLKR